MCLLAQFSLYVHYRVAWNSIIAIHFYHVIVLLFILPLKSKYYNKIILIMH